jgi:heme oxygenase
MNIQTRPEKIDSEEQSRVKRLRAATHATHETLDKRIMRADPFGSRERYGDFLKVQHDFHLAVDPFYTNGELHALIPDLPSRRRLEQVRQDITDLGGTPPTLNERNSAVVAPAEALGWLYVAEGSNLGAAILLKEARDHLELSENFGARHLAGHSDGRGLHWRNFTTALDAAPLTTEQEKRAVEGARRAFAHVLGLVERVFP